MSFSVDTPRIVDFLSGLLNTPSPTGYHDRAMAYVRQSLADLGLTGLSVSETRKGALVLTLDGHSADALRAFSAHIDTLGGMVREIKSNGRLLLTQLGGYAWNAVEGENVTVYGVHSGCEIRGTIQTIHPSVHTSQAARSGKRDDENMEVRLDARTQSKEETQALGIDVGDLVFFDPRVEITDTAISSRAISTTKPAWPCSMAPC